MTQAIFVPGLLCTDWLYGPQFEGLPGLDISIGDHRSHDSMEAIARHILDSAPDTFVLAGLSMGGYVAFEMMRQAPERVTALIVMDTGARADTAEQTLKRQWLMDMASLQGLDPIIETLTPLFLAERHHGKEELTELIRDMAHETGVKTFMKQQKAIMGRANSRPTLASITCPTLVLVGAEDTLTPPDLAKEIATGIKGAHLRAIEKCGHLSTLEQPEAVNNAIHSFLEGAGITS